MPVSDPFAIHTLEAGGGLLGICHLPGRDGDLEADIHVIARWEPAAVVTMVEQSELDAAGVGALGERLKNIGIRWTHLPVVDFGVLSTEQMKLWPVLSQDLRGRLGNGERILVHCRGGLGRSGMILLRLMCELGEAPEEALQRLRGVRPGAVETEAQMAWATGQDISS